jgi:sugar (pentulose or hexulose) kinase
MNIFLSIDAGSSFIKVIASNEKGYSLALMRQEIDFIRIDSDFSEFEIEKYWACCKSMLLQICSNLKKYKSKIKSISVCSHGSTFVFLDKADRVMAPAVFWMDSRAKKESDYLNKKIDSDLFYEITGQPAINSNYVPSKILWFIKNRKDLAKKVNTIIFIGDYLVFKLTGKKNSSYSLSSVSGLLDIYKKEWSPLILKAIGIDKDLLPELIEPGEIVEKIKPDEANTIGVPLDTVVLSTVLDQAATALGAGNYKEGIIVETTGTVLALSTVIEKKQVCSKTKVPIFYHSIADRYLLLPWTKNGGILLNWFQNAFLYDLKTDKNMYTVMDREAEGCKAGCNGLIFIPYLLGADFPYYNDNINGSFFGIKISHKRSYFIRAIMEAIGYTIRLNVELLKKVGISYNDFYSIGGGSKSSIWLQMKSDILKHDINLLRTTDDVGALGMNMLSALKLGIYRNIEEAFSSMNETVMQFKPNRVNYEIYDKNLLLFEKLCSLFLENFN